MMQKEFAKGLLDPATPPPQGVIGPKGRAPGKRYDVYRNNVVVSLSEALAAAYPVVKKLVGEEFFTAMAGAHVRQFPPKTPLMIHYGQDFPRFLAGFPPVSHLPYLPDVARLERARRMAYHGADAAPCPPEKLAELEGNKLFSTQFIMHPTLHIIRSKYPVFSIWRYNSTDDQSPLPEGGEMVLISRANDKLNMQLINRSTAIFIEALPEHTLGVAIDKATTQEPEFNLTTNLTDLLSAGLLVDIK